eukprot:IDg3846t1
MLRTAYMQRLYVLLQPLAVAWIPPLVALRKRCALLRRDIGRAPNGMFLRVPIGRRAFLAGIISATHGGGVGALSSKSARTRYLDHPKCLSGAVTLILRLRVLSKKCAGNRTSAALIAGAQREGAVLTAESEQLGKYPMAPRCWESFELRKHGTPGVWGITEGSGSFHLPLLGNEDIGSSRCAPAIMAVL